MIGNFISLRTSISLYPKLGFVMLLVVLTIEIERQKSTLQANSL